MVLYSLGIFHVNIINIVGCYERGYVKIGFASEISDDSLAFRSQRNAPSELPPHPRVENPSHGERHPGFERWPLGKRLKRQIANRWMVIGPVWLEPRKKHTEILRWNDAK